MWKQFEVVVLLRGDNIAKGQNNLYMKGWLCTDPQQSIHLYSYPVSGSGVKH